MANPDYPWITCESHGGPLLAYTVCRHVLNGAPVAHFVQATEDAAGEVSCAQKAHTKSDLQIACEACVLTQGWNVS